MGLSWVAYSECVSGWRSMLGFKTEGPRGLGGGGGGILVGFKIVDAANYGDDYVVYSIY